MKLNLNSYTCKNFVMCVGKIPANTRALKVGTTSPGERSQLVYVVSGDISYSANNNSATGVLAEGTLTNMFEYGQTNIYYTAGSKDAYYASLNPLDLNTNFSAQILNTPTTQEVVSNNQNIIIVCLGGSIICNGATISAEKYARVPINTTANLQVLPDSIALIVTQQ